jgi:hypothetical protein
VVALFVIREVVFSEVAEKAARHLMEAAWVEITRLLEPVRPAMFPKM